MVNKNDLRVYIFGAGASSEMGIPVSKGFFSTTYRLAEEHKIKNNRNDKFGCNYQKVAKYFETEKNIPLNSCYIEFCQAIKEKNIRLLDTLYPEQILEEIDMKIASLSSAVDKADSDENYSFGSPKQKLLEFQEYRDALEYIIFYTISQSMCFDSNYYEWMVNSLIWEYNTCLISLNYDTLLDYAIFKNYSRRWIYGVAFNNINGIPVDVNLKSNSYDLLLLKPHGSLNWLKCPSCDYLSLQWGIQYMERRYIKRGDTALPGLILSSRNKPCPKCNKKQGHFLIPPKPQKELETISNKILSLSKEYLEKTKKIIIIGYSFPEQDEHMKNLLVEGIKANINKPEIEIINANESNAIEITDRLKQILPSEINIVPSKYCGFGEYVKHIIKR